MATAYWFHNGQPFGLEVDRNAAVQVSIDGDGICVEFVGRDVVPVTLILPRDIAVRTVHALIATALTGQPATSGVVPNGTPSREGEEDQATRPRDQAI